MKSIKGFTLIELMTTIAILGVVAAVAIPSYTGYLTTAKMAEAKNNIAALKLAEEEFFLENNRYFFTSASGTNAQLATASGGLWSAKPGANGSVNFTYTVTNVDTYTITATGNSGTDVDGKIETYAKN